MQYPSGGTQVPAEQVKLGLQQVVPHVMALSGQTDTVAVALTVAVLTGVATVMVAAVMPQHEQALL